MATIEERGPYQFRAKVRRGKVSRTRTFETRAEAERWAAVLEGKVIGDEYRDDRAARQVTLVAAIEWFLDEMAPIDPLTGRRKGKTSYAQNLVSQGAYWRRSEFADWSLKSIKAWDLIRWRDRVLDADNAEDEPAGPDAECSAQTVLHRLNFLSRMYQLWALAHEIELPNPVGRNVRPPKPEGRDRRLDPTQDDNGDDEEARLLAACATSSRFWLKAACIIAIETCIRQSELAGLTWNRVRLDVEHPSIRLTRTKNDKPRLVPLSVRAVAAFRELLPADGKLDGRTVLPIETTRAIIHAFRDAVADANAEAGREAFPDLRWHDLRHEGISRLFELTDLRENEIMAISGHLTPAMLARYTHLRGDRLGDRLPGGRLNRR